MENAKVGNTVKVHYTGTLEDGTVFDSSREREPLEFTLGEGKLLPDFEKGVEGMKAGEATSIKISAEHGYGVYREDMVLELERAQIPADIDLQVEQHLQLAREDGQTIIVRVLELKESTVIFDANHPLAGKDLQFDIELLEIA